MSLVTALSLGAIVACREVISPNHGLISAGRQRTNDESPDSDKQITLAYMCGNRFRLRNPGKDSVHVKWDVDDTKDRGRLWLPPAGASPYSETFFTTKVKGTVRVFRHGSLIQTKANGGVSCGYSLNTVVSDGVSGVSTSTATFTSSTAVHYAATPSVGYSAVHVFVDGIEVAATGDILVDRERSMIIVADEIPDATAPDPNFTRRFAALLTSGTPVTDYQAYILAARALRRQVGDSTANAILDASFGAAFAWPRDSAAYMQLQSHLSGHLFYFDSLPSPYNATHPTRGSILPYGFPFSGASQSRNAVVPTIFGPARTPRGRSNVTVGAPLPVDPRTVQIVHVNGIATGPDGFERNVANLDTALRELPLLRDVRRVVVAGIYKANFPSSLLRTLADTATACALRMHRRVLPFLPRQLMATCADSARARFLRGQGSALLQAITQLDAILSGDDPDRFATTESIVQRALIARGGIDHVIMVPHSQGNLFTIQAFQLLSSQGKSPADSDAACFGAVPTASPTSFGYPTGTWRISPVQVNGDIILAPQVPGPKFPATNTAQSVALGVPTTFAGGSTGSDLLATVKILDAMELHNFIGSYLNPNGARELVKSAVKDIYSQCKVALTLNGPSAPLDSGTTYNLSLVITGADRRAINDNLPTRWSSSDSAVASVNSNGVVTAVGPGEALITATHRGKSTDVIVDVVGSGSGTDLVVTVSNSVEDATDPFTSDQSRIWRKQTISAQIQTADTLAYISGASLDAYDSNGNYYGIGSIPYIGAIFGAGVTTANGLFYDNPRSGGKQIRFGDAYWIITELYARVLVTKSGATFTRFVKVRVPPT